RESLYGQLMVALYHAGRQAEALQVYRNTRALLAEELAVEPTPQLQRLHAAVLCGDLPRPAPAAAAPASEVLVPRQLPPDVPGFVGRVGTLRELDGMLPGASGVAVGPVVITGTAGVGLPKPGL